MNEKREHSEHRKQIDNMFDILIKLDKFVTVEFTKANKDIERIDKDLDNHKKNQWKEYTVLSTIITIVIATIALAK
jgi:hypothetical protein